MHQLEKVSEKVYRTLELLLHSGMVEIFGSGVIYGIYYPSTFARK